MGMRKRIYLGLLSCLLVLNLTACGGGSSTSYQGIVANDSIRSVSNMGVSADFSSSGIRSANTSYSSSAVYEEAKVELDSGVTPSSEEVSTSAKLIRTVNISYKADENIVIESVDDFVNKVESLGGYAQSNNVSQNGRYVTGNLVLRLPAQYVNDFLTYANGKNLILVDKTDNKEDVTLQWTEIETRITVLEAQRDKYLSYIENAQTIEEILQVDKELQSVLTDLELYASQMRVLSNKVDYSTINISIKYVGEETETIEAKDTFLKKLTERLSDVVEEMQDMVIDAISALLLLIVPLITFMIIAFVLIQVFRLFIAYIKKIAKKSSNLNKKSNNKVKLNKTKEKVE